MKSLSSKINLCVLLLLLTSVNTSIMVLPIIQNCKVLSFLNACMQCNDGYTLNQGSNTCNKIQQKILQNKVVIQTVQQQPPITLDNSNIKIDSIGSTTIHLQNNLQKQIQPPKSIAGIILPSTININSQSGVLPAQLPTSVKLESTQKYSTILSPTGSGVSILSVQDLNCKIRSIDRSVCDECYTAFYYDGDQKQCVPVSPLCKTWNKLGHCQSCFFGFKLDQNSCKQEKILPTQIKVNDPNCFSYQNGKCVQCSYKFVFNKAGICTTVHPDCKTWDKISGACTSCFDGYDLKEQECLAIQVANLWVIQNTASLPNQNVVQIPNCAEYDDKNQCTKCAFRFYFQKGSCKSVSDLCKSWSLSDGKCMSCYSGYDLQQGKCNVRDPFCTLKSKSECVQCANRYYLSTDLKCLPVSPLCKAYDPLVGNCTFCYDGYNLVDGKCKIE